MDLVAKDYFIATFELKCGEDYWGMVLTLYSSTAGMFKLPIVSP